MTKQEKSEVQNLTEATPATEALDASPPAADTGHVAQGEPKNYGESVAVNHVEIGDDDPTEQGRPPREG